VDSSNKKIAIPRHELVSLLSGIFLTVEVPAIWENMTEEARLQWVDGHAWYEIKHLSPEDILDQIDCAVSGMEDLLRSHRIEVE